MAYMTNYNNNIIYGKNYAIIKVEDTVAKC